MFIGGVHPGGGHSWGAAILVQENYPILDVFFVRPFLVSFPRDTGLFRLL